MTTAVIESLANRGNIATADFQIGLMHRLVVIPAVLEDVGDGGWRRHYATVSVTAGSTGPFSLPSDFGKMIGLYPPYKTTSDTRLSGEESLQFIGEDPDEVAMNLAATGVTPAPPAAYWIVADPTQSNALKAVHTDVPADKNYTMEAVYNWVIVWPDPGTWTASVELDPYLPTELQNAIISRLRATIIADRYGMGDARYQKEYEDSNVWIERCKNKKYLARRNFTIRVV